MIEKMTKLDIGNELVVKDAKVDVDNLPWWMGEWLVSGILTLGANLLKSVIVPPIEGLIKDYINDEMAGKTIEDLLIEMKNKE